MKRAYLLTTTVIATAYLTILLSQGLSEEVSILRELATQRATVTRLSSCAEAIGDDLPRYIRREVEREVLRSASLGALPNSSNIRIEEWRVASYNYLASQKVLVELDVGSVGFERTNAPEGAITCKTSLNYSLRDGAYETELQDQRSITFVVPVRVYLMSEIASGFRSNIIGKIERAFLGDKSTEGDTIRSIIAETSQEFQRSSADRDLEFEVGVDMEIIRSNETTKVCINFQKLWVTDVSPLAEILVNAELTRVTFRSVPNSITLVFRRN